MHFRDKDEILVEICETTFAQVLALNTEIAAMQMEPVARVRRMLEAYMTFALTHPNAYQLVFCSTRSAPNDVRTEALRALGRRCYDLFAGAVSQVEKAGLLRCGDVDAAAQTSWAATHGIVTLLITQPNFDWAPRETLLPLMLDGIFDGLVRA
jgi:AcrR family transcriptional regulator